MLVVCRSRLSFKPFKTLDCRPAMLLVREPLYTTKLNCINRRMLAFSGRAFSAFQCISALYCVLFSYLGQITKMTHQPGTPHGFLLAMANHISRPDLTADFCVQLLLRKSSQAQKTTASVIGPKMSFSSGLFLEWTSAFSACGRN